MSEGLQVALGAYAAIAVGLMVLGVFIYSENYPYLKSHPSGRGAHQARMGARMALAAPVWPLAALVGIVWGLIVWVPRIVKDAFSHE